MVVVEVSWFAEQEDIDRAIARAAILQKLGLRTLPVVAARQWLDATRQAARAQHVILVQEHNLDKSSWDAALAAL